MMKFILNVLFIVTFYPTKTFGTLSEEAILIHNDAQSNDMLGQFKATMLDCDDDGTTQRVISAIDGAAYIWKKDTDTNNQWVQEQKLLEFDGNTGYQFGHSVAIKDKFALVGAPGGNTAYLFYRFDHCTGNNNNLFDSSIDTEWIEYIKFTPDAGTGNYGSEVELYISPDGTSLDVFISAPDRGYGFVYIYHISIDGTESLSSLPYTISQSNTVLNCPACDYNEPTSVLPGLVPPQFGASLKVSPDGTLVIGAPREAVIEDYDQYMGAVYVYIPDNTGVYGSAYQRLLISDPADYDIESAYTGSSVDISSTGKFIILGGPQWPVKSFSWSNGIVDIFKYSDSQNEYVELQELYIEDNDYGDDVLDVANYGISVSISDEFAIIGTGDAIPKTYVYIYNTYTDRFELMNRFTSSSNEGSFGGNVCLKNDWIAVTSSNDDYNGMTDTGAVYILSDLTTSPTPGPTPSPTPAPSNSPTQPPTNNLLCQYNTLLTEVNGNWAYDSNTCLLSNPSRGKDYFVWFGNSDGTVPDTNYVFNGANGYEISVDVTITNGNGVAGIMFGIQNLNSAAGGPEYYLWGIKSNTNVVKLEYIDSSGTTQVEQYFINIDYNTIYTLKVERDSNGLFNFYLDGVLRLGNKNLVLYQDGSAGLRSNWANGEYRNFEYFEN